MARGREIGGWVLAGIAVVFLLGALIWGVESTKPCDGFGCIGNGIARAFAVFSGIIGVIAGTIALVLLVKRRPLEPRPPEP